MAEIKDSGDRTQYETGAVRDCKEGKGRCDLMPLDVVAVILHHDAIIQYIELFKETGDVDLLYKAISGFSDRICWIGCDPNNTFHHNREYMLLEVSKHFEDGALKYGPDNWQKGIPIHSYIDSAIRHYLKWRANWTDEPHHRAFVWNLMCAIWTMTNKPELDDFTNTAHPCIEACDVREDAKESVAECLFGKKWGIHE